MTHFKETRDATYFRNLASTVNVTRAETELDKIMPKIMQFIENAAKEGQYSVDIRDTDLPEFFNNKTYRKDLEVRVKETLEKMKFKVSVYYPNYDTDNGGIKINFG